MPLEEEFSQSELEKAQEFFDMLESIKHIGKWPEILDSEWKRAAFKEWWENGEITGKEVMKKHCKGENEIES